MSCFYTINFRNNTIVEPRPNQRNVVSTGVGKLLNQEGFYNCFIPNIKRYLEHGFEISWLNVVREIKRLSWSNKTILSTLRETSEILKTPIDIDLISQFLSKPYEEQCDMLFDYHFNSNRDLAMQFLRG